jgi:RNA recognition motif-containing protein
VFSLAGKVITADVVKDKDGKSRGFGVVEMNHPIGAFKVIHSNETFSDFG